MENFIRDPNVKRNSRLIVILSAVLALIFITNAAISAYLLRKNSIQDRSDQLANLTIILSEHTAQTLFSANNALNSILDVVAMAKVDSEKSYLDFASKKAQFELLADKTKSNNILDVTTFVAANGKVINFSRSFPAPEIDLSNRDYFKYLSVNNDLNTFYSSPVKNKGNGKWVFYLARRINGRNNEFLGLVLVGVSVEVFSSLYERIGGNLGEGSAISLYRIDKTLLTRWPLVENLIGQVNTNGLIDESLSHGGENKGVIFSSGTGFVRQNTAPVERMISYRKVTNYPFIVGAVVPESIYLANWYRNTAGVFLATGFSLLALLIGATFLLKIYRRNAYNQYRAHYDSLTGLPNRLLFGDRLQLAVANCKRNGDKLAVLFIDLDNLKCINDVNGHAAGDFVLKEIASRMRSCLRAVDTVGRLGGDEFLVILPGVDSEASAIKIAEKIRHSICQPLAFEGQEICTSPSIGICFYPDHGQDEMELINNADMAMYEAKVSGRNAIKVFSEGVLQASLRDLA